MSVAENPKANPENLVSIVKGAYEGKVVVPEFQRNFVWARDDIEEFLSSILEGYFVGTFLMMDTSTAKPMFPFNPVEGQAKLNGKVAPYNHATVRLVLDGQQRITSLFYALYAPDIPVRWATYPHKFFLRLEEALEDDLEEAVVGISTRDRRRTGEIQKLVKADRALPFPLLRESQDFYKWFYNEQQTWTDQKQKDKIEGFFQRLQKFMIPVVSLSPETGKENIVNIFERINRTGISLSLFDLAVARMYLKEVHLRDLWDKFVKEHESDVAQVIKPEYLLKLIALFKGKEPRKGNLLDVLDDLEKPKFEELWEESIKAITLSYKRISQGYGAFESDWIPYTTMSVPLAALVYELKKSSAREDDYRKLDRWFWTNVFTQRYDSAVDTKTYQDNRDIIRWIKGKSKEPEWLNKFNAQNLNIETDEQLDALSRDLDLDVGEQRSAVYRGLICLIARQGAKDFLTGQPANLNECQDDHIFPKGVYGKTKGVNTIFNRTLISMETNKKKGSKKPSVFMKECLAGHGNDEERLLKTLNSHFISKQAYIHLKNDDFDKFVEERGKTLLKAVIKAIG